MTTIRELIDALAPESDAAPSAALELADGYHALEAGFRLAFGQPISSDSTESSPLTERGALSAYALDALRRWIPKLDADTLKKLGWRHTPIDLAPRLAELAAERRKKRKAAVVAEPCPSELASLIDDDPDDEATYRVLADRLIQVGEPRGELIALELARAGGGNTDEIERQAATVFATHVDRFLGPLADYLPDRNEVWKTELRWRWGYVHGAKLGIDDPGDDAARGRVAEMLELLLSHPSGRFLVELSIGIHGVYGSRGDLRDIIAVIARRAPPTLRTLHLGDFEAPRESDISAYDVGNLAKLWRAVPRLQTLIVQGGSFSLGDVVLPEVEHVELITTGLSAKNVRAVAAATWPELRHLEVWFGASDAGGNAKLSDIEPLFARTDLELDHLGLRNAEITDELCRALVDSPLLAKLNELDVSDGCATDDAARILTTPAFAHLESLDVSENYLSQAACERLEAVFGTRVVIGEQKDAEDGDGDRFVSVGE